MARPKTAKVAAKKKPSLPRAERPPKQVARDLFLVWRAPRVGMRNPQRLTNPVWSWLARCPELSAYRANAYFDGPSSMEVGPGWCGNRFGRSVTELPDGRVISIAGEHEDHYDPDFFIYNDVIVTAPSGEVEIYGYGHDAFPPTDFHSATRVGDRIVILGCLGYPSQRDPDVTPVFSLDTGSFVVTRLATSGARPGWIYEHSAEHSADEHTLAVRGGKRIVLVDGVQEIRENIDDWSLNLEHLVWTRLTDRQWPVWDLARADGKYNQLLTIEWMSWHVGGTSPFDREQLATHQAALGYLPDFEVYASRYAPPIEHARVPDGDEVPRQARIVIDGVTVRYVEGSRSVRVTVEGALSRETVEALLEDARRKLELLERSPYVVRSLGG